MAGVIVWSRRLGRLGFGALLAGCSDAPPPMQEPEDLTRSPAAPAACQLVSMQGICPPNAEIMPELGGAGGGLGGSGPVGDTSCLWRYQAELSCPAPVSRLAVGRGSAGELDLAVAQKGRDGREPSGSTYADERLHLATFRMAPGSAAAVTELDPIDAGQRVSVGIVPGNADGDSLLALHRSEQHPDPSLSFLGAFGGGDDLTLPALMQGRPPITAAGPVGDRTYVELVSSAAAVVEGLASDPRRVELGEALALAVDYDDLGEPYVLVHQESELRLLAGPDHDELLWSEAHDSSDVELDLLADGGGVPGRHYVLVSGGSLVVQVIDGDEPAAVGAVTRGENTCSGWSLNFDCSTCPIGTPCQKTDFLARGARLFAFGERVFVAVHWRKRVESREADTDTSFIGICVCDSTLLETAIVAEYVSFYEVGYHGPGNALELSFVWETQVGDGNDVASFGFARDAEDGLDFWYGPALVEPDSNLADFPSERRRYFIEHYGGQVP